MPDSINPPGAPGSIGDQLFARFANALTGKLLGEVPDEEKVPLLEGMVSCLDELTQINRYFAANLFRKFGDQEAAERGEFELARKPDIRDFLSAWATATIQFLEDEAQDEDGGGEGGDDYPPDDDGPGEGPLGAAVIDADFKVTKTGKKA